MGVSYSLTMILGCVGAAFFAVLAQFGAKSFFDSRQYGYLRDLLLTAVWMLLGIWFGPPQARFVVGAAFIAGIVGLAEDFWPEKPIRAGYLLTGVLCAFFGPTIGFIRFMDEGYIYLPYWTSIIVTSFWFAIFPVILQQLDHIAGLVGHMLAVTFSLMLISVGLAASALEDAFFLSFSGLVLLGAFWSRFSNFYRRAGKSMAAMWGVLVAGTAIMGGSKGIVFSSMLYLSFGLFAIPFASASLYLASLVLSESVYDTEHFYRKLLRHGLDHPSSVRMIAGLCALLGTLTAFLQAPAGYVTWVWGAVAGIVLLVIVLPLLSSLGGGPITYSKPCLWGVDIDNVSINYALARGRGMLLSPDGIKLVSTVNALAMEEAVRDAGYHRILRQSAMVLSDGAGLLWGLRFLGMPIQERVTGIDFAEQMCRMAAAEGWPVYFLGSRGKTALACAKVMEARYPGLVVAGARDGFFDAEDPAVADAVAKSGARILFVAMGIPRQEKWVARHADRLGSVLAVGVGGAFDVLSGNLKRAPVLMQKMGMEWLFRLYQEPFRWKKDLGLVVFVLRILATRVGMYKWK
ncbi:MAG: WecB/TagA/CpsF family glycosyltransferase [Synergistaceae bacterium]|nr:WecB/TagA/CpsF family glycosyltransferase [Synergistaceae bacterium]